MYEVGGRGSRRVLELAEWEWAVWAVQWVTVGREGGVFLSFPVWKRDRERKGEERQRTRNECEEERVEKRKRRGTKEGEVGRGKER